MWYLCELITPTYLYNACPTILHRSFSMAVKKTKPKAATSRAKPIPGITQYFYVNKNGHTVYTQNVGDVRSVSHVIWNQERDPTTSVITHFINLHGDPKKVMIKSANGSPDARYNAFENVRNEATKMLRRAKK